MNIIILLTSRPTDNLRVLVLLRALMFDVHHSLRYVTLCCVFCSSFTHCNFKEFLCRFNGRSFEVFLKRRKILEQWNISFVCEFQGWTSFSCYFVYFYVIYITGIVRKYFFWGVTLWINLKGDVFIY